MKYSGIGGQAVIEGIMMKNKDQYATAVRRPDGGIEVKKDTYVSMTEKVPFCGLPFVRGVFSFADSMILGMRTLSFSASFFEDDEDSEPGKLELWLDKVFGEKVEQVLMAVVMVFSVVMAIGIFMVLPLLIANACKQVIHSDTIMAILEGVIRIAIFIAYIKLISRMEDIRRTFMYHGAEHKCINCIEHGMTLTVDHVRESSKQHKRCGTSFLIIVMLISILFFMVVRVDNVLLRMASRIILVPVIAGVSYEFLRRFVRGGIEGGRAERENTPEKNHLPPGRPVLCPAPDRSWNLRHHHIQSALHSHGSHCHPGAGGAGARAYDGPGWHRGRPEILPADCQRSQNLVKAGRSHLPGNRI